MKCGIVIFPSKEVQDFANSYRKRYDPHYSLIQPHLTIREAEDWTEERLRQAVAHLDRVTSEIAPFTIHFNRFSTFYPVSNTVYMALEDPDPFIELYERICQGALHQENSHYHYNPHLTVGRELSSDELHDVYASLRKVKVDFHVTVDRVHLLYQTENLAWSVYQTFLLRG